MKSLLISIQPKWCELIASGKKTIELRKTRPKIDTPFKSYIYCTLPPRSEFFWHKDEEGKRVWGEYAHELIKLQDGNVVYDYGMRLCLDDREYTSDNFLCKKVIGEFMCDYITTIFFDSDVRYGEDFPDRCISSIGASCVSLQGLKKYSNGKDIYGWHISNLVIYDKPRELSDFATFCKGTGSATDKTCKNCRYLCFDDDPINGYTRFCGANKKKTLTRPPQSWCYIKELR